MLRWLCPQSFDILLHKLKWFHQPEGSGSEKEHQAWREKRSDDNMREFMMGEKMTEECKPQKSNID
jgi:hypothetical protein